MQIQHKEPLLAYRLSLQLPHVDGNDDRSTSACGRRMRRREVRALLQCCSPPARSAPPCSLAQETVKAVCIPLFCSTFCWPSFFQYSLYTTMLLYIFVYNVVYTITDYRGLDGIHEAPRAPRPSLPARKVCFISTMEC